MDQAEAMRQATEILDSGMKGFDQKLINATEQMQEQRVESPPFICIREYEETLQESVGQGDIPKKQLDVLEQILYTLAKSRPDLVAAQQGAIFQ
jgi:hypothetical protein